MLRPDDGRGPFTDVLDIAAVKPGERVVCLVFRSSTSEPKPIDVIVFLPKGKRNLLLFEDNTHSSESN